MPVLGRISQPLWWSNNPTNFAKQPNNLTRILKNEFRQLATECLSLVVKPFRQRFIGRERFSENLNSESGHQHRRDGGGGRVGGVSRLNGLVIQRGQTSDATELLKQSRCEAVNLVDVIDCDDLAGDSLKLSSTTPTAASPFSIRMTPPTLACAVDSVSPTQTKLLGWFFQAAANTTTQFDGCCCHAD